MYYRHFGKYFGSVIKGIFSDEPSFAHFAVESGAYPYNETAAKRYKERIGKELAADIKDGVCVLDIYFQIRGNVKKERLFFPTNYIRPWFCGISDFAESAGYASECAKKRSVRTLEFWFRFPYAPIWDIPEKYRGKKVHIRIEQYTSVAPLLGRACDIIKDGDGEWWAPIEKWFGGRYEALGIEKLEFVKKIKAGC